MSKLHSATLIAATLALASTLMGRAANFSTMLSSALKMSASKEHGRSRNKDVKRKLMLSLSGQKPDTIGPFLISTNR